jgi:thiol-disulfide isomerase/thioredoxin
MLTFASVAPVVQRFAAKYPHAVFAKVDVDAQQAIAQTYQVTAM